MKTFEIKWVKKKKLNNAYVVKGIPGIGNISHICVDYLKHKLDAKLICKIYSKYLPNIVIIDNNSSVDLPHYSLYYKKIGNKKLVFLIGNYQPKISINSYEFNDSIIQFLKKQKVKELITIAGIGYKSIPKKIKLHIATSNIKIQKKLKKYKELVFDGNKSVALIIGSAGLLIGLAKNIKLPAFSVLASTWAHPSHIGIKESKKVVSFLCNYLSCDIDFSDLNKEIRRFNKERKKISEEQKRFEKSESTRNYIG